jgi:hypothetical protein
MSLSKYLWEMSAMEIKDEFPIPLRLEDIYHLTISLKKEIDMESDWEKKQPLYDVYIRLQKGLIDNFPLISKQN